MGVAIPNASTRNWFEFRGKTSELGPGGMSTDYRQFVVSKPGEFNFKINNTHTTVQIINQRNEVMATAKSGTDIAQASAKLAPGTYTAVISQQFRGLNLRDYSLEVTPRQNPMVLASGTVMRGMARAAVGQDQGVQRHSLNVVQGGEFIANLSMPYSRFSILDKDGKVVAAGDTMKPEEVTNFLNKRSFKLEPGQYEMVMVFPRKVIGEVPWQFTLTPKIANLEDAPKQEREVDRILREREARLRRFAEEDAARGAGRRISA